jgi:hypothetical protein
VISSRIKSLISAIRWVDLGRNVYRRWPSRTGEATRISGRGVSVVLTEDGRIKLISDYCDFVSFFPGVPAYGLRIVISPCCKGMQHCCIQWISAD